MRNNCQGCDFNCISTYGSISVSAYGYLSTPQIAGLHKMKHKSVYTSKPSHLMSFLVASRWQITQHMARTGVNTRKSSICRFCTFLKVVLQVDESTVVNSKQGDTRHSLTLVCSALSPLLTLTVVLHNADHEEKDVLSVT